MGAGFNELGLHGSERLLTEPNLRCGGIVLLYASYYIGKAAKHEVYAAFLMIGKIFLK